MAGQTVTIQAHDTDKYGRTIGDVILEDGRNLSQELVKAGYAWWYRKYAPDDMVLEKLEAEAREAKAGLWNDPHPIAPWDFRHRGAGTPIEPGPSLAPSPKVESHSDSFDSLPVVGNLRSGKYHRFDCPSYDAVAPHNRLLFPSVKAAKEAGFEVAGNCPH